ncbi:adenosylcobinamide amidohydrolase [Salidesulfovibrio onnuriiensis]|uniref:adenosylcobinamide amidohydrolase n=1 Tax=Salidesulfovibrio onnuriiensis TaxID=2583823 RepID=UPI0011C77291|nr:adenosylcobinamide amidohydrolase [Salidesulfovibrio onnuriiensis]
MTHRIEHTADHVHVALDRPRRILSSAVLGGGFTRASHILNLRVEENFLGEKDFENPEHALARYAQNQGWSGAVVGLMTAASMDSFRACTHEEQGISVTALTTSGLSNARCAGDPADCHGLLPPPGTINTVLLTNVALTDAAMVEALLVATEAKSAVLRDMGIQSRASSAIATGTGTDALVLVSGEGPPSARFCGKHVLPGQLVATTVMQSLKESLQWYCAH